MMKKKIGELLRESGAVQVEDVKQALGGQRSWGVGQKLGQLLVAMRKATPQQLARALAEQSGLPYVELGDIPPSVSSLVPVEFQAEHKVVPFGIERDGKIERLLVAVADPSSLEIIDELRFQLARQIRVHVAPASDIEEVVKALRGEISPVIIPVELGEDGEDLVLDTRDASMVPDGWFSIPEPGAPQPHRAPERPTSPQPRALHPSAPLLQASAPAPRAPPPVLQPAAPVPQPSAPVLQASAPAPRASPPVLQPAAQVPQSSPPVLQPVRTPRPPSVGTASRGAAAAAADLDHLLGVDSRAPKAPAASYEDDLRLLRALEQLARGEEPAIDSPELRPAQMVASLIQLLLRKGVISHAELLAELRQK